MKNLIPNKARIETLRVGTVRTTYRWDGRSKKPVVTHSCVDHTIPDEGSLNTVLSDTNILPEV